MTGLRDERGSVLPVTAGLLSVVTFAFLAVSSAGALIEARLTANSAAHSLAVRAAAAAMAGQPSCAFLRDAPPIQLVSCHDTGTDVHVVVVLSVDNRLRDSVAGESRVGYGGGNYWVTDP